MKKVIIIEKSKPDMNAMFDMFMDLLDTSVDVSLHYGSEASIRTGTHEIRFFHNKSADWLRGFKADIIINNTDNKEIDEWARYSGTIHSKYRK